MSRKKKEIEFQNLGILNKILYGEYGSGNRQYEP